MQNWSNERLCDVANLILGAILLLSPFIFNFPPGNQSDNAYLCGAVIVLVSIGALHEFAVWEEWLNLIVGLWVFVSPWAMGFAGTTAAAVDIVVGIIVVVLAAIEIWLTHHHPPRITAH